ncbi:MAG: site-specific recombinase, phage integrase family [Edaphobacter sp.]|nr:site-specific recombinase, phage integrase family [Edaphobacter sp.]
MAVVTFGAICDRYIQEELPERHSTSRSYRSNIKNYLKPRWGDYLLDHIRPMAVEDWLKKLPMAPKSKTHIRSVMHLMYECATRWGAVHRPEKPDCVGTHQGRQQALSASHHFDCGPV